jgi:hypothetical protein
MEVGEESRGRWQGKARDNEGEAQRDVALLMA